MTSPHPSPYYFFFKNKILMSNACLLAQAFLQFLPVNDNKNIKKYLYLILIYYNPVSWSKVNNRVDMNIKKA